MGIRAGTLFETAGCSQESTDQSTSLTEVTNTILTVSDEDFGIKLGSSELIKNFLDFKWQDISSVTSINTRTESSSRMHLFSFNPKRNFARQYENIYFTVTVKIRKSVSLYNS